MLKVMGILAGVLVLLSLFNFLLGIRPITFQTSSDPSRYGLSYEPVAFKTDDGLLIRGWFIPAGNTSHSNSSGIPKRPAILIGHGYPFDKANILPHVVFLHRDFHLLLIDFRYFGESDGAYTTVGLKETLDVAAAVAYLQQREEVDPERIGAMGFSMSAAIILLAQNPAIKAIVADSPYASLTQVLRHQFFFLPGPLGWPIVKLTAFYAWLFLGVDLEEAAPAAAVRALSTPVLLIHGEADSQLPVTHAYQIAANADPRFLELWIVSRADHGQAHALAEREYEQKVLQFFARHLLRS
ncbi:MAG: hypothetical protein D6704_09870 [Nitrospirae bacterium]|nr:MAG: hypothetical protein D6704_09870 [Nitrospirota bacterium]